MENGFRFMDALKWAGVVFAAGFVRYFGKYFGKLLIEGIHQRKTEEAPMAQSLESRTAEYDYE